MSSRTKNTSDKQENLWISLGFNIILPVIILSRLSDDHRLGPLLALILAVSLPLGYGVWDFSRRRKYNLFSALGFVSVMLTGGLGLMQVGGFWFAVKEAAIPAIFGLAVLVSLKTRHPLVRTFIYNDRVIQVRRVEEALSLRGNKLSFERLLFNATILLASSFFLSAVLNFILATMILQSPTGSVEFNKELGRLTALSFPIIVLPCMIVMGFAMWKLITGLRRLTGLDYDQIFNAPAESEAGRSQ